MKLVKAFRKARYQCFGLYDLGKESTKTLYSRIFSSNGAQHYFANETEFHASFYCKKDQERSFVKGPLSYADSLKYCENHGGKLGEFDDDFSRIVNFVFSHTCTRKDQPNHGGF